jgi:hypothetical protein
MSTRVASLPAAIAAAIAIAGCAPRMEQTHYERWASQDAKRRAERAAEEQLNAKPPAVPAQPSVGAKPAPPPMVRPTPPPADTGYNSLSGGSSEETRTATKSRAIKPADEDDAIY